MPQGHRSSVPPIVAVTNPDLAVVRFHGHSDKWQSKNIYDRFGYLYSEDELQEWVPQGAHPRRAGRDRPTCC